MLNSVKRINRERCASLHSAASYVFNIAELWQITRMYGLSLGDRACLAFAIRRQIS